MQLGIRAVCQTAPSLSTQSVTRTPRSQALLAFIIRVEQSGPPDTTLCIHRFQATQREEFNVGQRAPVSRQKWWGHWIEGLVPKLVIS